MKNLSYLMVLKIILNIPEKHGEKTNNSPEKNACK